MRMLMQVQWPNEPFNTAVRDGTAGKKMQKILAATKPEVAYFTEDDGFRTAFMVINVDDPTQIPALAEPWFLTFHAEVRFRVAMTPEELGRANLESLGKEWA